MVFRKQLIVYLTFFLFVTAFQISAQRPDSTTIQFQIVVPEHTPEEATIFWAGSLNSWDPGDLVGTFGRKEQAQPARLNSGYWSINITAPTGSKVRYKYTRGSIFSVEESPDYTYRPARTVTFDNPKTIRDTVEAWHDIPPKALANQWPKVELTKANRPVVRDGRIQKGMSTILYGRTKNRLLFNFDGSINRIKKLEGSFTDTVAYYQRISPYTDQFQLVVAGRHTTGGPWHIYLDRNNDQHITSGEKIFTLKDDSKESWSGNVSYRISKNDSSFIDSTRFTVREAHDIPSQYRSTRQPDAPDLVYTLPLNLRSGSVDGHIFYLQSYNQFTFKDFSKILIDRNNNDTLEVGSGSNETYATDAGKMKRQGKYYLHPTFKLGNNFWTIANVDSDGDWVRLRPADQAQQKKRIAIGEQIPSWTAKTINDQKLSSDQLEGTYVLLDFWGSWCGPCIEQIPKLKEAHQTFADDNFQIIGIAYDSQAALQQAVETHNITWPQVLDEDARLSSKFNVYGYPTYYLINPKGKVIAMDEDLPSDDLIDALKKYIR